MNRFTRHWRGLAIAGLAVLMGLGFYVWSDPTATPSGPQQSLQASDLRPMMPAQKARPLLNPSVVLTEQDNKFITSLREKFGPHINNKHAQIRMIEQIMAYMKSNHPGDWNDRLYVFLRELFPDLADALFEKFQQLVRYDDWLRDNRDTLLQLSDATRRQALWDARREAFGPDAEEIFAGAVRNEKVQDALAGLNDAENLRFDEKLSVFLDAVHEAYGDSADRFIQNRQTELMNRFVEVPAVQADLHAMSEAERSESLRQMRSAMGLDEAALARWDSLDRERDQAWGRGQNYMEERRRIESQYQGDEREQQMRELQDREFGEEAQIIRNEEEAGFYRYDRKRRYGRE